MDVGTLEQILWHIHNWFDYETIPVRGCSIDGGSLPASVHIPNGALYRIQGSLFNDGLHQHPSDDLADETFSGTVTVCAVPKALMDLSDQIADYMDETGQADSEARKAKFQSESFGGYSYTIKGDSRSNSASDGLSGWQAAFRTDLNPWRKIS